MISLGKHKAKIVHSRIGANDNGNPFVAIRLQVPGEEDYAIAKVYLTAKALGFAARTLKACGFDIHTTPLEEIEADPELMAGHLVEIEVTEQEYNGHSFRRVEIVVPRPTVEKSQLAALTKGMREAAKKSPVKDSEISGEDRLIPGDEGDPSGSDVP